MQTKNQSLNWFVDMDKSRIACKYSHSSDKSHPYERNEIYMKAAGGNPTLPTEHTFPPQALLTPLPFPRGPEFSYSFPFPPINPWTWWHKTIHHRKHKVAIIIPSTTKRILFNANWGFKIALNLVNLLVFDNKTSLRRHFVLHNFVHVFSKYVNAPNTHILISKYSHQSPIKETRAPWWNGWF